VYPPPPRRGWPQAATHIAAHRTLRLHAVRRYVTSASSNQDNSHNVCEVKAPTACHNNPCVTMSVSRPGKAEGRLEVRYPAWKLTHMSNLPTLLCGPDFTQEKRDVTIPPRRGPLQLKSNLSPRKRSPGWVWAWFLVYR
jgi:hypothetical protein